MITLVGDEPGITCFVALSVDSFLPGRAYSQYFRTWPQGGNNVRFIVLCGADGCHRRTDIFL